MILKWIGKERNLQKIERKHSIDTAGQIETGLSHQLFDFVAAVIQRLGEGLAQDERIGTFSSGQMFEQESDGADAVGHDGHPVGGDVTQQNFVEFLLALLRVDLVGCFFEGHHEDSASSVS